MFTNAKKKSNLVGKEISSRTFDKTTLYTTTYYIIAQNYKFVKGLCAPG